MSLKGIAQEILRILEQGKYTNHHDQTVVLFQEQQAAIDGTLLYTPQQSTFLLSKSPHKPKNSISIRVTPETTQIAAKRLVEDEGCHDLVVLNFASARNPGGGFITGAKAQEEDVARASGIYPCLLTQPAYYNANRHQHSLLYTDHCIYSPNVPWFRTDNRALLDRFFLASIITAPAPNAGEVLRRDATAWPAIETTLRRRAGIVLAIAAEHNHRSLLLGAWGCGVFRNQPSMVADAFGAWLEHPRFQGCFDQIVFAVYDPSPGQHNLHAFQARF